MTYDPYPTKCNICGGHVSLTTTFMIYGRNYGTGLVYSCDKCGARVGTYPRLPEERKKKKPPRATGILADEYTRNLRMRAHGYFDSLWSGKRNSLKVRAHCYWTLAGILGVPEPQAHFAMMNREELKDALRTMHDHWDYMLEDASNFEQMTLGKEKK